MVNNVFASQRYLLPHDLEGDPELILDWRAAEEVFAKPGEPGMDRIGVIIGNEEGGVRKVECFLEMPVGYSEENGFFVSRENYDPQVAGKLAELRKQGKDCKVLGHYHFHEESFEPSVHDAVFLFGRPDGAISAIMMAPRGKGALGHMRVYEKSGDEIRELRYALN